MNYRPNNPETQLTRCLLLMLGVKLITLSVSPSPSPFRVRSGVCGTGTVLPRGRVGVVFALALSLLLRKLRLFAVRLASEGWWFISFVVGDNVSLLDEGLRKPVLLVRPTIRMVVEGIWCVEVGGCARAVDGIREVAVEACVSGSLGSIFSPTAKWRLLTST